MPIEGCFLLDMEEGTRIHREWLVRMAGSALLFLGILLTATEERLINEEKISLRLWERR